MPLCRGLSPADVSRLASEKQQQTEVQSAIFEYSLNLCITTATHTHMEK